MKVCNNPECMHHGELQPLENFYKHRKHKDGYCSSCKDCAKAHRKTEAGKATYTRWNNSEKGKQAMRKFERSKYGRTRRMKYREEHADSYKEW